MRECRRRQCGNLLSVGVWVRVLVSDGFVNLLGSQHEFFLSTLLFSFRPVCIYLAPLKLVTTGVTLRNLLGSIL